MCDASPRLTVHNEQALTCLIAETSIFIYGKIGNGSFGVVRKGDWTTPSGAKVINMSERCFTLLSTIFSEIELYHGIP